MFRALASAATRDERVSKVTGYISPASYTLSSLSEVLGFDVIEFWTPTENCDLQCTHYFLSDPVMEVVNKIYSDPDAFTPNNLSSWKENSIKVCASPFFG